MIDTPLPSSDVSTLRLSRVDVLQRLIDFGRRAMAELRPFASGQPFCKVADRLNRITHWLCIAIALQLRIGDGALDAPRAPKTGPEPDHETAERPDAPEREYEYERLFDFGPSVSERAERYLDRPFGEVVALICKGLGMKPDWDAWADEPWAQVEASYPPSPPGEGQTASAVRVGASGARPPALLPTSPPRPAADPPQEGREVRSGDTILSSRPRP